MGGGSQVKTYKYFYEHRSVDGRLVQTYEWLYAQNVTEAKAEAIRRLGEWEVMDPRHRKLIWVDLD